MKKYQILRACLFFAINEEVSIEKFKEYFTEKSIRELLLYGYIKVIAK